MTDEAIEALYDLISGKLEDEGWPKPWKKCVFVGHNYVVWRKGETGSAVILSTEDGTSDRPIVRHSVAVQILDHEGRFVLIDLTKMPIWPGDHSPVILVEILRHFKSVIE